MTHRVHLLADFGGPIMDDTEVEHSRKTRVLEEARKAGIIQCMSRANPAVTRVGASEFEASYDKGKQYLKMSSNGAEAYDDIRRLAAAMVLALGEADYKRLLLQLNHSVVGRFWDSYGSVIAEAARRSMKDDSLLALKRAVDAKHAMLHVVSDNWSELFCRAFEPVIGEAFTKHGLPDMEYRAYGIPRRTNNCTYVSGAGWGNKKMPETWRRILGDLCFVQNDMAFFVDDSEDKLDGLDIYAREAGLGTVYPVRLLLDGGSSKYRPIRSMEELTGVMDVVA